MRERAFLHVAWLCFQIMQAEAFVPFLDSSLHNSISTTLLENFSAGAAIDWIKDENLESLLPKDDALAICNELLSNKSLIDDSEALVEENWDKIENRIRNENRSAKEILGEETTERLLKSIGNIDVYDNDAVRVFLGSDAVNNLFAKILCKYVFRFVVSFISKKDSKLSHYGSLLDDGIYEFFQTIDVFGNIISNLPIIGPIRNQIRDEIKKNLDRTLGPLVQSFLRSYTKVAVIQASDFIMSPANKKAFGNANIRLVSSVLERPVSSLLPPSDMAVKLRSDTFDYVRNVKYEDLEEYANFVYDLLGDTSLSKAVDVDRILDASPTLTKTVDRIFENVNQVGEGSSKS
jgi:hypothetical protein